MNDEKTQVRTRFAPSPTGYMHVGGVRTALFTYLIAKHLGGEFLLRIEDTDQSRYVEGATELIFDTLKWIGLDWDNEPVFQTSRKDIYLNYAQKLIAKGLAYADPYTPEEVQKFREADSQNKRAFLYRNYRPANPPKWQIGMPLRFKQTNIKRWDWHDEVMGDLSAGAEVLDDIILIKKDGLPTYNFAHIVDDYKMGITHITRGQEYLPSTPNYLSIYEALEIERPKFVTIPHILAPTGGKKLSKRDGAKSVTDYRDEGILPEAMTNFLAFLGWNDGTEREIFSLDDLIKSFDISRIHNSGARFDEQKLIWLNGQWLRKIDTEELSKRAAIFWGSEAFDAAISDNYRQQVLELVRDRLKTLSDLPMMTAYFFKDPTIDLNLIQNDKKLSKLSQETIANYLQKAILKLNALEDWSAENLQNSLNDLLIELAEKPAVLFSLIRIALSFAPFSPQLNQMMALLGKDTVLARLNKVADAIENN
ncbi:MAG: glutamate--tRNA ligase [Candidatus Nomurabacteria bacterium]|jgi:glutamyl-tRNA synthetase|nr:glutamate--tRNA ligase [Candidatus Nomurabacteria bacterium]